MCFRGGLELLFSNQRKHHVALPTRDERGKAADLNFLVHYLCNELMQDSRKEMFMLEDSV